MGCDIHAWVEKRVAGKWHFFGEWEFDERSYDLFGALANVRTRGAEPILPAVTEDGEILDHKRGWPADASPTILQMEDGIGHSPSWLTLAELLAYSWEKNDLGWFEPYLKSLKSDAQLEPSVPWEDLRIVFYFDS